MECIGCGGKNTCFQSDVRWLPGSRLQLLLALNSSSVRATPTRNRALLASRLGKRAMSDASGRDVCWRQLGNSAGNAATPDALYGHSTVVISDSAWGGPLVVTFGGTYGEGGNAQAQTLWIWHFSTGWDRVDVQGVSPPPRGFHAAAVQGPLMYIFGGNRYGCLHLVWRCACSHCNRAG